jgi:hypothetical protein
MDSSLCQFNADTLRCERCGFRAKRLPTYRVCRTIHQVAEKLLVDHATKRIHVPPLPIGTAVAFVFSKVGITKERVSRAMGKDCGCAQRAKLMDHAGAAISQAVENIANAALNAMLPIPVEADEVAALATALAASEMTNDGLKAAAGASPPPAPPPNPP